MNRKELAELVANAVLWFDPYIGLNHEEAVSATLDQLKTKAGCFVIIEELANMLFEDCPV